jgi:hypothetical protein
MLSKHVKWNHMGTHVGSNLFPSPKPALYACCSNIDIILGIEKSIHFICLLAWFEQKDGNLS